MIKLSTPPSNSYRESEEKLNAIFLDLHQSEDAFYESIVPALDELKKEPSEEIIQKILNFSKSLS